MNRIPLSMKVLLICAVLHVLGYYSVWNLVRASYLVNKTYSLGVELAAFHERIGEGATLGWNFSYEVRGGRKKSLYLVQAPVAGDNGSGVLKCKAEQRAEDDMLQIKSLHLFTEQACTVSRKGVEQACAGDRVKRWNRRESNKLAID